MNKINYRLLSFMLLTMSMLFHGGAYAATLTRLYEVAVPVFSQGPAERRAATTAAFEELLIRVTGKRDVLGLPAGRVLLSKSRRYVRSFRYELIAPSKLENIVLERSTKSSDEQQIATDIEDEKALPTQNLVVSFDEKAVKNSLWQQKLPVWSKTRPSVLLWVAQQEAGQRSMLDLSVTSDILPLLRMQAEKRGIPLVFPRLDSVDRLRVNVTDVWGGYEEPVVQASKSYQADAVVSARFFRDQTGMWQTRWQLYLGDDGRRNWQLETAGLSTVIEEAVDQLAGLLAERYAQVSTNVGENKYLLQISDVSNLADYEKINRYLKSLSAIKRAELARIQSSELVYELELRSNAKALKQAISLGKILLVQDDPFADDVQTNRLNYRLNP